jgi:hypothetical protein
LPCFLTAKRLFKTLDSAGSVEKIVKVHGLHKFKKLKVGGSKFRCTLDLRNKRPVVENLRFSTMPTVQYPRGIPKQRYSYKEREFRKICTRVSKKFFHGLREKYSTKKKTISSTKQGSMATRH